MWFSVTKEIRNPSFLRRVVLGLGSVHVRYASASRLSFVYRDAGCLKSPKRLGRTELSYSALIFVFYFWKNEIHRKDPVFVWGLIATIKPDELFNILFISVGNNKRMQAYFTLYFATQ